MGLKKVYYIKFKFNDYSQHALVIKQMESIWFAPHTLYVQATSRGRGLEMNMLPIRGTK